MLVRFRWFEERVFAGSDLPEAEDISWLYDQGIRAIISFERLNLQAVQVIEDFGIEHYNIDIEDFGVPTLSQIEEFFAIIKEHKERKQPLLIHCEGGKGRTGTMAALYLIQERDYPWQKALEAVGGVETGNQENLIRELAQRHNNSKPF